MSVAAWTALGSIAAVIAVAFAAVQVWLDHRRPARRKRTSPQSAALEKGGHYPGPILSGAAEFPEHKEIRQGRDESLPDEPRRMVPVRTGFTVERTGLMAELVRFLCDRADMASVPIVALVGAGGFGKTTLAAEACRNDEVITRFPAGILWVTLGEGIEGATLATKINDLSELLSGHRPTLSDPDQAGHNLGVVLGETAWLLVIDDVWSSVQLRPFAYGSRHCSRLITTRLQGILPDYSNVVRVDNMEYAEAVRLLTARIERSLPEPAVRRLVGATGQWPVLLSLVNRALRRALVGGATPEQAVAQVERRLGAGGPVALDTRHPDDRARAAATTIGASLTLLSPSDLDCYEGLAIFAEDVEIPRSVLYVYWGFKGLQEAQVDKLCEDLEDLSLILSYRHDHPALRLHSIFRGYLRQRCGQARLTAMNEMLLKAVSATLPSTENGRTAWWRLSSDANYLWHYLPYHFQEAGRHSELVSLLRDLNYVTAKITLYGPAAIEADFALVADPVVDELHRAIGPMAYLLTKSEPDNALTGILLNRLASISSMRDVVIEFEKTLDLPRLISRMPLADTPDPALRRSLRGHTAGVWGCAVSPDGTWLVTTSDDETARIWDVATGQVRAVLEGHGGGVWCCAISPDGERLVTGCADGMVRVWDVQAAVVCDVLEGHSAGIWGCAVSPDGTWLVTTSDDETARIWDVATGQVRAVLEGHGGGVWCCAISPDGERLVTGCADGMVRVWDVQAAVVCDVLEGHSAGIWGCAVSPDGTWLVTASDDETARIWDVATGQVRAVLEGHTGWVRTCSISSDGGTIVTAGADRAVRIWDVASGRLRAALQGHSGWVRGSAVSPDSTWFLTVSVDATAQIWGKYSEVL